jgi:hypothetical protein
MNIGFRVKIRKYSFFDFSRNDSFFRFRHPGDAQFLLRNDSFFRFRYQQIENFCSAPKTAVSGQEEEFGLTNGSGYRAGFPNPEQSLARKSGLRQNAGGGQVRNR